MERFKIINSFDIKFYLVKQNENKFHFYSNINKNMYNFNDTKPYKNIVTSTEDYDKNDLKNIIKYLEFILFSDKNQLEFSPEISFLLSNNEANKVIFGFKILLNNLTFT